MTRHLDNNACIDILSGAIGSDEAGRLLDHARECPDCEARFRARAAEYETLTAEAPAVVSPPHLEAAVPPKPTRRLRRLIAGAGAVAAAVIAIVLLLPSAEQAPAEYWLPAAGESIDIRSAPDSGEEQLTDGLAAYDARDLDAALAALDAARVTGPYEDLRRIYLASTLTLSDRAAEALAVLDGIAVNELPQPWRSQATWIRYLALDATGDVEAALVVLEELAGGTGDIAERAAARLEAVRGQ